METDLKDKLMMVKSEMTRGLNDFQKKKSYFK